MTLPRDGDAVWCPNCRWTGSADDVETVLVEDRLGRSVRKYACPKCGLALDTE